MLDALTQDRGIGLALTAGHYDGGLESVLQTVITDVAKEQGAAGRQQFHRFVDEPVQVWLTKRRAPRAVEAPSAA